MMDLSRFVNLFGNVDREYGFHAAGQRGFPLDQMPCLIAVLIFSALNERCLNADLGAQQVFPLVPSGIPRQRHCGLIKRDFQLPARVSVHCSVLVECAVPQWDLHAVRHLFGQKREDAGSVEGRPITRAISGNQQGTKAAVWKECGCSGITQEGVVTSPQLWMARILKARSSA